MPGVTIHFLLTFSYAEQRLLDSQIFNDIDEATAAYAAKEREYADRPDQFEIVLVGADSIETIEKTHGHYFRTVFAGDMFEKFLSDASMNV